MQIYCYLKTIQEYKRVNNLVNVPSIAKRSKCLHLGLEVEKIKNVNHIKALK
jgi:hypothetical protein